MPVDRQTAIEIAKRHKLGLADAMALSNADDEAEAEEIAKAFDPPADTKAIAERIANGGF